MTAESALVSRKGRRISLSLGHQTKSEVRLVFYRMQRQRVPLWGLKRLWHEAKIYFHLVPPSRMQGDTHPREADGS